MLFPFSTRVKTTLRKEKEMGIILSRDRSECWLSVGRRGGEGGGGRNGVLIKTASYRTSFRVFEFDGVCIVMDFLF